MIEFNVSGWIIHWVATVIHVVDRVKTKLSTGHTVKKILMAIGDVDFQFLSHVRLPLPFPWLQSRLGFSLTWQVPLLCTLKAPPSFLHVVALNRNSIQHQIHCMIFLIPFRPHIHCSLHHSLQRQSRAHRLIFHFCPLRRPPCRWFRRAQRCPHQNHAAQCPGPPWW